MYSSVHNKLALSSQPFDALNVLVVDGSTNAGTLIKGLLEKLGFNNVFVSKSGFEGVQVLKNERIDLIFTDWELLVQRQNQVAKDEMDEPEIMPISGSLFVKRLRSSPASPNPFIPVIMLLQSATDDHVALARDSGVNEIIIKPFNASDFSKRIMAIIDDPRMFITANTYRGPCRRRSAGTLTSGAADRRIMEVRLVKRREGRWI